MGLKNRIPNKMTVGLRVKGLGLLRVSVGTFWFVKVSVLGFKMSRFN